MSAAIVSFEVRDFAKGFVAALVEAGSTSLQPMNPKHRRGLYRVWAYLSAQTEEARDANKVWFRSLVRIRNRVDPGHTGTFDQFQTELRDLQMSMTESPNPSYEDISFSVSRPFARSLLNEFSEMESELVRQAAGVFLQDAAVGSDRLSN